MINYIVRKSWPRVEIASGSGVIKNILLVKFHFFAIDIVNNAENVKLLAPPTNYVDVTRGVSRLRRLKKKEQRGSKFKALYALLPPRLRRSSCKTASPRGTN